LLADSHPVKAVYKNNNKTSEFCQSLV